MKELPFLARYFEGLGYWETDEEFVRAFDTAWRLERKCRIVREQTQFMTEVRGYGRNSGNILTLIRPYWFLKAYHMGLISRDILYKAVLEYFHRSTCLEAITQIVKGEWGKSTNYRLWENFFGSRIASEMKEKGTEIVGEDTWCGRLIGELYEKIVPVMVDSELRRGEAETPFSPYMSGITFIQGTGYLVRILMALGKDTLGREAYYSWYYSSSNTRKDVLSRLLKACYPAENEDGKTLKAALEGTSIKKEHLVEVAMYAPQWVDVIQEYLGWSGLKSGCYYFMAHMNERFDDQKHSRARKYADAASGKVALSKLAQDFVPYMQWTPYEDVELCLHVDAQGKSEILCRKDGKMLKSVPSRLGKKPYVAELKEAHKKLKDQHMRTRKMMEESMESGSCFTGEEAAGLLENPVVYGIITPLVFVCGQRMGFLEESPEGENAGWDGLPPGCLRGTRFSPGKR